MGAMQSIRRTAYSQKRRVKYRKTYIHKPLGRCSTLIDIPSHVAPAVQPQKRQKYDPTYSIWKSAFEDRNARSPRTLLPIKEDIAALQDITDAVAGQCTPKGFPSFTELRESMRCKKTLKCQDVSVDFGIKLLMTSALLKPDCKLHTEEICVDSMAPVPTNEKVESTENCFHTALYRSDFNFFNESLCDFDIEVGDMGKCEERSSQLSYYSD
ncbi:uncharacterized protein LOC115065797 [Bactrocera dorsalis]|uniref:Uncharacterized protein LOC115065797 n=1 Tax=Bactrocera dorsalis TaxID=27457 RepID=A0A8N4QH33_BACDO|nr:uncharacterized protein LOC115065797 [Bactrocera dorsalis]